MDLSEVRAAAERLTATKLGGAIATFRKHPGHFQIHLNEETASQLFEGSLRGDASLLCIQKEDGWIVNLVHRNKPTVSWTDLPDEHTTRKMDLIRLVLENRLQPGEIRQKSFMSDSVRDFQRTVFDTDAGPLVLSSRRLDEDTGHIRFVLEIPEQKTFLEFFRESNGQVNLSRVREFAESPDLFKIEAEPAPVRIAASDAGRFLTHSGVAIYNFALEDLRKCLETGGEAMAAESGRSTWRLSQGQQTDTKCLEVLMGVAHERNHFVQTMSTPTGLLLWRIQQAIISTARYLLVKMAESPIVTRSMRLPLAEWYADEGRELVRENLAFGPHSKQAARAMGVSPTRYIENLKENIEVFYEELDTLVRFSAALSGKRVDMSMAAFVSLANEAFRVLAINNDLTGYPLWKAHDPDLETYLPEQGVTLTEIMEGDSRLLENMMLQQANATDAHRDTWTRLCKAGKYAAAYDWLLAQLGSPEIARVAIEIALTTPIDLICTEALKDGVIYVEDCLPSWRLKKVVEALQRSEWPRERSDAQSAAMRGIAQSAGIPTPGQTLMAMRGKRLSGESAWGADSRLLGIPEEKTMLQYFTYCEQEITRGLITRSKDPLAFSQPQHGGIFQPAMEFYTDTVLSNGAPGSHYDLKFYLKILITVVSNRAVLEIFFGEGDLTFAKTLEAGFLRWMAQKGITPVALGWRGLREIVERQAGPDISTQLQW